VSLTAVEVEDLRPREVEDLRPREGGKMRAVENAILRRKVALTTTKETAVASRPRDHHWELSSTALPIERLQRFGS
jgi:hypothetical protein